MPDYIYLLENRLSRHQQSALAQIRQAARGAGMTVFLVGGAVRDLASGSPVRDLDIAVHGNALKLKKKILQDGAELWGEHEASRTLFLHFPVGVRVELSSTRSDEYPKPGHPVHHWAGIQEDLRRRDFTANAMALSLNEHSYGLLIDPLNGMADIEGRLLRLTGSYGFLEDPARLIRATRLAARLGWDLEERTRARYQAAKDENAIAELSAFQRGYELEEIVHEEDGLKALAALQAEGWMERLDPAWTTAQVDTAGLEQMHRFLTRLQMQNIFPDTSATSMQYLTAKMAPKHVAALKHMFVRPGFVAEWERLETAAKDFGRQLAAKDSSRPSVAWNLFHSADPQAVLWLGLTSKSAAVQARYDDLFNAWPAARQKVPTPLLLELRITPELPIYEQVLHQLFLATIDGKVETEEQLRAFLEPHSPPAPPPPVIARRSRASRKSGEAKIKAAELVEEDEVSFGEHLEQEDFPASEEREEERVPVRAGGDKGGGRKSPVSATTPAIHEQAPAGAAEVLPAKPAPPGGAMKAVKAPAPPTPEKTAGRAPARSPAQTAQNAARKTAPETKASAKLAVSAPGKSPAKAAGKKAAPARNGSKSQAGPPKSAAKGSPPAKAAAKPQGKNHHKPGSAKKAAPVRKRH